METALVSANWQRAIIMFVLTLVVILTIGIMKTQREMVERVERIELIADAVQWPRDRTLVEKVLPYCHEDEGWVPVDYQTPGALVDSRGVTRMCVHLDNIYVDGSP